MTNRVAVSDGAAVSGPAGADIRRWTQERIGARERRPFTERFTDVYMIVLTVAVWSAMVAGLLTALGEDAARALTGAGARDRLLLAHPTWLVVALLAGAVTLTWSLAARLGPVGLGAAPRSWWLTLPVERRTLLRPVLVRGLGAALAPAAVIGAVCASAQPGVLPLAVAAPLLALAGTAVLGFSQTRDDVGDAQSRARRRILAADLSCGAVLVGALVVAARHLPPPTPGGPGWWALAGAAGLVAVCCALAAERRLDRMSTVALARGGDVLAESAGALASLDTRGLGRALDRATPVRAGAAGRFVAALARRVLPRLPRALRPGAALVVADGQILVRSPRRLVQVLLGLGVLLLALGLPGSRWIAVIGFAAGAWIAAVGLLEGARLAQLAPAVDALVPLGQRGVRAARLAVPALALALWGGAAGVLLGAQPAEAPGLPGGGGVALQAPGSPAAWALIGGLAGVGVAAGALRGAYRPLSDYSGVPKVTPFGTIPPGLTETFAIGPDVAVLALTPTTLAVLVGGVPPLLLAAQAAVTSLVVAVAIGHERPA